MNFDVRRLSQLAGVSDLESSHDHNHEHRSDLDASQPRRLNEGSYSSSGDESQLRLIIRREARKMIQEHLARQEAVSVRSLQERKSLVEAITMGFAGIGFGPASSSPVLGGPHTSAPRVVSYGTDLRRSNTDDGAIEATDELEFSAERWAKLALHHRR